MPDREPHPRILARRGALLALAGGALGCTRRPAGEGAPDVRLNETSSTSAPAAPREQRPVRELPQPPRGTFPPEMEEVISEATAVEVLATWSTPDELLPRMARVVGRVRGHAVRAAETVTGPAVGEIAAALRAVLDARDLAPGCFSPRHALRFRSPTDEVVFVICFECILVLGFWRDAACSINLTRERASFEMRLRAAGVGVDFGA